MGTGLCAVCKTKTDQHAHRFWWWCGKKKCKQLIFKAKEAFFRQWEVNVKNRSNW